MLVETTAPELNHQIAQAEATLAQMQATLQQSKANRDLAQVTWDRDSPLLQKGWITPEQGDADRLTLKARDAAVAVARSKYHRAKRNCKCKSTESLSKRRRAVRWRNYRRNIDVGIWCTRTRPPAPSYSP